MTLAREYFQRVLSPWVPGVDNPLPGWVEQLAKPEGTAVDVGSGPGVLLCYLAQRFGKVVAVDRDRDMVDAAAELVEKIRAHGVELGQIELRLEDWADCEDIRGADLVCAVNSILEPDPTRRARMLTLLRRAMRPGATLLAVFPSMEAQIHLLRLYMVELERREVPAAEIARLIDAEFLTAHNFDALEGTFSSRDEPAQKFYYQLELAWEMRDAGFQVIEQSPIVYPWDVCRRVDAGYFPGEVELFDWFIRAQPASGER